MANYLCEIAEVGDNGKEVCVHSASGPVYVMLFPYQGSIRAYINECPHQRMPLNWAPDTFMMRGQALLICAHHGARFDLGSGKCMGGACRGEHLQPLQISLDGDSIWLAQDVP